MCTSGPIKKIKFCILNAEMSVLLLVILVAEVPLLVGVSLDIAGWKCKNCCVCKLRKYRCLNAFFQVLHNFYCPSNSTGT